MKTWIFRFNIYFAAVALIAGTGCKSPEEKKRDKERSTLQLHLEVNPNSSGKSGGVTVFRAQPTLVNVMDNPFLDHSNVNGAAVVPAIGGFSLKIQFDSHGTLVLDNVTTAHKGRRIAIYSTFGDKSRWLAAWLVTRRITNGELTFTPDATIEEAERIARGLNNVAAEIKKKSL